MSKKAKYNFALATVRNYYSSASFHISGRPLSSADQSTVRHAIEAWSACLIDLYPDLTDQQFQDKYMSWMAAVMSAEDLSSVFKVCKDAYDMLIEQISSISRFLGDRQDCYRHQYTYKDFKGLCQVYSVKTTILLWCKTDIQMLLSKSSCYVNLDRHQQHLYKQALARCAQFLLFCSKIELSRKDLQDQAIDDYIAVEESLAASSDDYPIEIMEDLRDIITRWFKNYDQQINYANHGPGAVADVPTPCLLAKYKTLQLDQKLAVLLRSDAHNMKTSIDDFLPFGVAEGQLERCSKLCFVPKNFTKLRTISSEPTMLQFLQQAGKGSMYHYFQIHPFLRKIINLEDQTQNRFLAYYGSHSEELATIDLSHASDSVTWALVKYLCSGTPKLLKWLIGTRSTHTLMPNGEKLLLKKFAPMGSAYCFPIETLVFAAIIQLVKQRRKRDNLPRTRFELSNSNDDLPPYSVYGDDIIIPQEWATEVVDLLEALGFEVNQSKSFTTGLFKESCGINCFDGYDITPLKYHPKFQSDGRVDAKTYTALIAYCNQSYYRRLKVLRSYLINLMNQANLWPEFTDDQNDTTKIFSPCPTNFHLKGRRVKVATATHTVIDPKRINSMRLSLYDRNRFESQRRDMRILAYHMWLRGAAQRRADYGVVPYFESRQSKSKITYYPLIPIWLTARDSMDENRSNIIFGNLITYQQCTVLRERRSLDYRSTILPSMLSFSTKVVEVGHGTQVVPNA